VYILDQVRALEQEMRRRLEEQGLPDIKPNIMVVTRLIPQVCIRSVLVLHPTV
jgi:sucrose synthase